MMNEDRDEILPIDFNHASGEISMAPTGQVRRLGSIAGRDVILLHKEKSQDVNTLSPTDTTLLIVNIASALLSKDKVAESYYTSATYKPSRLKIGLHAGLIASAHGKQYSVAVPTYGYENLEAVKGNDSPTPPTIQQIAGEIGKTVKEAHELRDLLDTFSQT